MTRRLVSTPSSTKMAGHRSRISTTNRARLSLASSQAEPMEKKVGDETTTTSARPAARPAEQHAAGHEAEVAQGLAGHPVVRGGEQPGADHAVAVPPFPAAD